MVDDEVAIVATVGVIGLGLIGGSVAASVITAGGTVVGWDPDPATRAAAAAGGVTVARSAEAVVATVADGGAAARADELVVVVAAPLADAPGAVAAALTAGGADGPTITDVASVKGPVLAAAAGHPAFVASHPMAGTERSGWAAASPTLFVGAPWLVLVDDAVALHRVAAVARLALAVGARPVPLDPAAHDGVLATISHLPHVLAAVLTLQSGAGLPLAAGSLHGAARVAAGDPALPTAMVTQNREAVVRAIDALRAALGRFCDDPDPGSWFTSAQAAWDRHRTRTMISVERPWSAADLRAVGAAGGHLLAVGEAGLRAAVPADSPAGRGEEP